MGPDHATSRAWNWVRFVAVAVLLVVTYFVVPVRTGETVLERTVLSIVLLVGLAGLIRYQVRHHPSRLGVLVLTVMASVATCALACYALAVQQPGQFEGLNTRTDALYFTIVTMTTVGFGDIHPVGQQARWLVIVMIMFSVGFIGSAAYTISEGLRTAREAQANSPKENHD